YLNNRPPVLADRVATVITGELRAVDNKTNVERLNRLTNQTDVFVCTDRKYKADLWQLRGVVASRFLEDDLATWKAKVNLTKEIQWWRLQQCWSLVQWYEETHGFSYVFYFKTRTDCFRRGGCASSLKTYERLLEDFGSAMDKMMFARSDMTFGGTRRSFARAAGLFSRIGDYWKRVDVFWPLNYTLVQRSDGAVNKYVWLVFPRAVIGPGRCCEPDVLRRKPQIVDALNEFVKKNCRPEARCSRGFTIASRLPLPPT
ncbi:unnamed protein product, partial [Symbiodinium pilosum]